MMPVIPDRSSDQVYQLNWDLEMGAPWIGKKTGLRQDDNALSVFWQRSSQIADLINWIIWKKCPCPTFMPAVQLLFRPEPSYGSVVLFRGVLFFHEGGQI